MQDRTLYSDQTAPSPALDGFAHVRRQWDAAQRCWIAKILPGEYYVTGSEEAITTVLGSCVSACIRDPLRGVGGMNHFMLPEDKSNGKGLWTQAMLGRSTRYGSFAMERLINDMLKLGARRERLEIKLFGGGRMLASMTDVGARNIAFVKSFVELEGFNVVAEDLGDFCPRRVLYFPATGRVLVKRLKSRENQAVASREQRYLNTLAREPADDDIELFD